MTDFWKDSETLVTIIMDGLCDEFDNIHTERDHNTAYSYLMPENVQERINGRSYYKSFAGPSIIVFRRKESNIGDVDALSAALYAHVCIIQVVAAAGEDIKVILRRETGIHWHYDLREPDSFDRLFKILTTFGLKRKEPVQMNARAI